MKQLFIFSLLLIGLALCNPNYNGTMIRGINLGGWMVLEPFINPSLLSGVGDEWNFCSIYKNDPNNLNRLRTHWDTWVTESDIQNLTSFGITHFRIPIGYWIAMTQEELDNYNEPWLTGGWDYVVRALKWIQKYNAKAIIDIHALPGSQNPWPHSGKTGSVQWGTGDTLERSYTIIDRLSQWIKNFEQDPEINNVMIGFEVMNEAFPPLIVGNIDTVKNFYVRSYDVVRAHLNPERYMFIIEEAFNVNAWPGFMSEEKYKNVVLDVHTYQCFDDGLLKSPMPVHLQLACSLGQDKIAMQTLPTFTGEWSVAYKEPSDTAATEAYPNDEQKHFLQQYSLAQMSSFETGIGWFWWNFKTETASHWDWYVGRDGGWLPCSVPSPYQGSACPIGEWDLEPFQCNGNMGTTGNTVGTTGNQQHVTTGQSASTTGNNQQVTTGNNQQITTGQVSMTTGETQNPSTTGQNTVATTGNNDNNNNNNNTMPTQSEEPAGERVDSMSSKVINNFVLLTVSMFVLIAFNL